MMRKNKKTEEKTAINLISEIDTAFAKELGKMCEGLMYISETDAEFTVFVGSKNNHLTKETILSETNSSPNVAIEEQMFDEFFLRLTTVKDWFGAIEKKYAERFSELQKTLKSNLKDLKVFRLGKIKIDIYIVGIDSENNLIGLKTNAVET
jgi:hypothetical protein